ncbi:glutathione synthase [Catalinimonas alkaloidigena]|uniref:glutathione synthetase n=1 Tax=Catalinimonas alkaloidigena TaxID=1075417 RepID=UPI00240582D8|nr:glutathione synthetase [Catalinimonas alkaloidigena]MDF9798209.1 glutathione synthase [Catalinimonas alkaloidigena]
MKIAFVINSIETEKEGYTTIYLALSAYKMGHEVFIIGVGDLGYTSDGHMVARAKSVKEHKYKSSSTFLKDLRNAETTHISSVDLDVIFLRNNPADDMNERNWAQNAPYIFAQIALKDNVIVLNHPGSLSDAINKMYFQHFPEILRPRTIITRDPKEIHAFFKDEKEKMILKPLQGSGGANVFMVDSKSKSNLNQIIEAISRDGYIIAQEYLPKAKEGDTRLFLMNGKPLQCNGKYAGLRRVNHADEIRSNIHAGGQPKKAEVTEEMLQLVEVLRPKLVQDGMFLVGVDIVGDKLMEVNVFSPGGLNLMSQMYEVDYGSKIIRAIEKKVYYRNTYDGAIDNKTVNTL